MIIKYLPYIIAAVLCALFSYGISGFYPFLNAFSIIFPLTLIGCYFFYKNRVSEEELTKPFLELIENQENALAEQTNVISEYEKILDSQFVTIDCDCKNGKFEGFFEKDKENFVKCENCENDYKITVNYDAILISNPLENEEIFQELKEKSEKEVIKD